MSDPGKINIIACMNTKRSLQIILWIFIYISLTIAPLVILLIGPRAPSREFFREFSVALGFAGLAMAGLQFALTARFKTYQLHTARYCLLFSPPDFHSCVFPHTGTPSDPIHFLTANDKISKHFCMWKRRAARAAVVALLAMALLVILSVCAEKTQNRILRMANLAWHSGNTSYWIRMVPYYSCWIPFQCSVETDAMDCLYHNSGFFMVYTRIIRPLRIMMKPYIVDPGYP